MTVIVNCTVFTKTGIETGLSVLIKEGKIFKIGTEASFGNAIPAGASRIDAGGSYLSAGLIDLQIYGSGGDLFSAYPSAGTLRQMDDDLLRKGTTGFLACVATNAPEVVEQAIKAAKEYRNEAKGFLGLHLEGPYINAKRKGAHIEQYIYKPSLDDVKRLFDLADGVVKMMTVAAELQDDAVLNFLSDQQVVLSLGHSDADFKQANAAFDKGFKTVTHLFNAMPSIHHRAPNLPAAVLNHNRVMASIIADGVHVDFEMIRMCYKLMKERLFLITDAVTPCNIGPYQHQLSGDKFVTPDGILSGSAITMLDAIRNVVKYSGIPLIEALKMASEYPARLIDERAEIGSLLPGSRANLILLSKDLQLEKVFINGVEHQHLG
ncbi:N-acetylglucosamine-6-phosphate deacetylase [Pedobacter metabolipauper]|uniref:N-acetylglucosamine-6-phosphate deacetylase n=1 Tax=Pedobacter metabolipauper TaxID=425513 RepID=A0A4R6SVL7_9SPHI|nr:N-acetylglucosamine-6-phosphate deacetylase [Pedobacter metabolipauper]TDQ09399.1 N-acetylglucosamine-6-phosphate deacetylase [Pedobacter metabolipauper]